jgi:hypothetical protein
MISTALCIAGVLTAVACGILLFSIYGVYYIGLDTEVMKTDAILTLLLVNFIVVICLLISWRFKVIKIPFVGAFDVDVAKTSTIRQLIIANFLVVLFLLLL